MPVLTPFTQHWNINESKEFAIATVLLMRNQLEGEFLDRLQFVPVTLHVEVPQLGSIFQVGMNKTLFL